MKGRLGYAYASDPSRQEVGRVLAKARANAELATEDQANALPPPRAAPELPRIFRQGQLSVPTERKVTLALELERATVRSHARVGKVEQAAYGDSVSRVAIASTTGRADGYVRTDCWCASSALAET